MDDSWKAEEAPLLEADPFLNIFALANGLDLTRNETGRPDRTLEWYREGMERRLRMRAGSGGMYEVEVGVARRRDGEREEAWRPLRPPSTASALLEGMRDFLTEGVDSANEMTDDAFGRGA